MSRKRSSNLRRPESKATPSTPVPKQIEGSRLVWFWALLLFLCVTLFPFVSDDFYWNLSRGRAVFEGEWAAGRSLLAGPGTGEADWLGGVPVFCLYQSTGLSGLMVTKLAVAAAMLALLFREASALPRIARILASFVILAAIREGWDLTSMTFDLFGILLLWRLTESNLSFGLRLGLLATLFLFWANLGVLPVLGLLILCWQLCSASNVSPLKPAEEMQRVGIPVCVALLASCCSPRGIFTLWDSLRLLLPWLVADAATLASTQWRIVTPFPLDSAVVAFGIISCLTGISLVLQRAPLNQHSELEAGSSADTSEQSSRHQSQTLLRSYWRGQLVLGAFLMAQVIGWSSRANLPVAALWTGLIGLKSAKWLNGSVGEQDRSLTRLRGRRVAGVLGVVIASLWAVSLAGGWWPSNPWRLGWGLHPQLELQLCRLALSQTAIDRYKSEDHLFPSVHCVDVRGAGMLAWLRPGLIRPYDTPRHALLAGRLRENVALNQDLAKQHTGYYRRADGSVGGWWLRLAARNTKLLMIPNTATEIIRGLEPVLWKPLSIDSPVLPYAIAGDPEVSPRLLKVVQERHILERESWSYTRATEYGEPFIDLWTPLTGQPDTEVAVKLASSLQAMELWTAALRVLRSELARNDTPSLRDEFNRCQQELAYREQLEMGRPSWWRALAAGIDLESIQSAPTPPFQPEVLTPEQKSQLEAALTIYRAGHPGKAAATLKLSTPELLYARAQLELEAGNSGQAHALLEQIIKTFPRARIAIAARHALESFTSLL